jgi:hypothetical protein
VVKVFKSVGAVRVYNGWNAAGAAVGIALLIAGIGFAIGWLLNDSDGSRSSSAAASDTAGRQAAYQQGLAAGRREAAGPPTKAPAPEPRVVGTGFKAGNVYAFGTIKSAGSYFVDVRSGKRGLRVGPHVSAKPGNTYWVCGGGKRICFTTGNAPSR